MQQTNLKHILVQVIKN